MAPGGEAGFEWVRPPRRVGASAAGRREGTTGHRVRRAVLLPVRCRSGRSLPPPPGGGSPLAQRSRELDFDGGVVRLDPSRRAVTARAPTPARQPKLAPRRRRWRCCPSPVLLEAEARLGPRCKWHALEPLDVLFYVSGHHNRRRAHATIQHQRHCTTHERGPTRRPDGLDNLKEQK